MNTRLIKYRPPRIAITLVLAALAVHLLTPAGSIPFYASPVAAVFLVAIGFAIMITAWWQFKQRSVAICPTHPTARLITDGIYRFSRNPMYLGMTAMLAGLAVWLGTLPFYLVAASYFFILRQAFCPYEEKKLHRTFGAEYQAYISKVRRWI